MPQFTGREFMKKTRYRHLDISDQRKGVAPPLLEMPRDESKPMIELPSPSVDSARVLSLADSITNRRSVRTYTLTPLTVGELSYLLWCTQGVKETLQQSTTFRTVPSAGARHAFETYILVNNVETLKAGLYRYLALDHNLEYRIPGKTITHRLWEACLEQDMIIESAAAFFWTAVQYRMTCRYGERGYRYLHLDAGHVCQNLYLAGESVGCGVCAIAAFDDDLVNQTLEIDGVEQFAIYMAAVGKV